jgi:hypothetical protein
LVVFAWVFPENSRTPRGKAAVLFAPGIVLIPAAAFGLLWRRVGFEIINSRLILRRSPTSLSVTFILFSPTARLFFFGNTKNIEAPKKVSKSARFSGRWRLPAFLKTLANIVLPFFGVYELLPFSAIFVLPAYDLRLRDFQFQTVFAAIGARPFRLFPIAYKIALSIASVAILSFILFKSRLSGGLSTTE